LDSRIPREIWRRNQNNVEEAKKEIDQPEEEKKEELKTEKRLFSRRSCKKKKALEYLRERPDEVSKRFGVSRKLLAEI